MKLSKPRFPLLHGVTLEHNQYGVWWNPQEDIPAPYRTPPLCDLLQEARELLWSTLQRPDELVCCKAEIEAFLSKTGAPATEGTTAAPTCCPKSGQRADQIPNTAEAEAEAETEQSKRGCNGCQYVSQPDHLSPCPSCCRTRRGYGMRVGQDHFTPAQPAPQPPPPDGYELLPKGDGHTVQAGEKFLGGSGSWLPSSQVNREAAPGLWYCRPIKPELTAEQPPDPGEGYELLPMGPHLVQDGEEYYSSFVSSWFPTHLVGKSCATGMWYRRPKLQIVREPIPRPTDMSPRGEWARAWNHLADRVEALEKRVEEKT